MADAAGTTDDRILGGRLLLRQPLLGHRAGHDAVLLAASVAAKPGDRIVELGAGVGAAGLALAARVPGIELAMVEIDAALTVLAAFNAEANAIPAHVIAADVTDARALDASGVTAGAADAVMMNPPFHGAARHRPSPDAARRVAHSASDDTLRRWVAAAYRLLKPRGALTLIWRADGLSEVLAALSDKFGSVEFQPVHGGRNKPAVRILVRAVRGGRAPLIIHPAAWLDKSDERVEAAMRGTGALRLAGQAEPRG